MSKTAGWLVNSIDPDQTPPPAASDLDLHCLVRPVLSVQIISTYTVCHVRTAKSLLRPRPSLFVHVFYSTQGYKLPTKTLSWLFRFVVCIWPKDSKNIWPEDTSMTLWLLYRLQGGGDEVPKCTDWLSCCRSILYFNPVFDTG